MTRGRYEAYLLLKLAEAEKKKRHDETDALANPLMSKTDSLLKWIADETSRLTDARKPENLGASAAESKKLKDALDA